MEHQENGCFFSALFLSLCIYDASMIEKNFWIIQFLFLSDFSTTSTDMTTQETRGMYYMPKVDLHSYNSNEYCNNKPTALPDVHSGSVNSGCKLFYIGSSRYMWRCQVDLGRSRFRSTMRTHGVTLSQSFPLYLIRMLLR